MQEKFAKAASAHAVASSGLATAVLLCQQLLLNICHLPGCCRGSGLDVGMPAMLTTSSVGAVGRREPSSVAEGETFEIINLNTLFRIGKSEGDRSTLDLKSKGEQWGRVGEKKGHRPFWSRVGRKRHSSDEECVVGR